MKLRVAGKLPSGWATTLGTISALVIFGFLLAHLAFVERGLAGRPDVVEKIPGIAGSTVAFLPNHLYGPTLAFVFFLTIPLLRRFARGSRIDLVFPVFLLCGIGMVLLYRLSPEIALARGDPSLARLAPRHFIYLLLGIATMLGSAWWFDERRIKRLSSVRYIWVLVSAALILLTGVAGVEINDRRLWLRLGPLQFQTVELVKVCLLLFLAGFLADVGPYVRSSRRLLGVQIPEARYTGPFLVMAALALLPIFLQKDLGPTLLLFWLFLAMFYIGAGWASFVAAGAGSFLGLAVLAYAIGWPTIVRTRVLMWLNPFEHPNSEGIARALWAVAGGGWTGTGLGYGLAADIPIVQSDFNFAALVEEIGFLGGLGVLGCFGWFLLVCARTAAQAPGRYTRLLASGITLMFAFQAALIVSGNLNLVPMTGITLPFVSYGGSSLLVSFLLVGVMLRISALPERETTGQEDHGMAGRGRTISFLTGGLYVALIAALGYLMLVAGERISREPHRDGLLLKRMARLIDEGVVVLDDGGQPAVIDEARLVAIVPGTVGRNRVQRFLPFLYEDDDGGLTFDPATAQVSNPRLLTRGGRTRPGRIYDRAGRLLAGASEGRLPGSWVRDYPYGAAVFHVVGHRSHAYGTRFIEHALEPQLSGTARRSTLRKLRDLTRSGRAGDDVFLTIDAELSRAALDALDGRRGAVVVLDVYNGDVLALVSSPSFDPGTTRGLDWSRAEQQGQAGPLLNRAVAELYPPGSTFKIIVDAAWREVGEESVRRDCSGFNQTHRIRDFSRRGHGDNVDMSRALAASCNVYFADLGPRLGDRLRVVAEGFGFNASTDLLAGDFQPWNTAASRIFVQRVDEEWRPYDAEWYRRNPKLAAQTAIGQNQVVSTPLQMVWAAATIGRGGAPARPRLVRGLRAVDPDEAQDDLAKKPPHTSGPVTLPRVIGSRVARRVLDDMKEVMVSGTGARLPRLLEFEGSYKVGAPEPGWNEIAVAGKSGTAQVGDQDGDGSPEPSHAWFLALAPAADPRVAVAVLVEHGGGGSGVAGPIAVKVLPPALAAVER